MIPKIFDPKITQPHGKWGYDIDLLFNCAECRGECGDLEPINEDDLVAFKAIPELIEVLKAARSVNDLGLQFKEFYGVDAQECLEDLFEKIEQLDQKYGTEA